MSDIDALVQIITNSVKNVQAKCTARGMAYPTLSVPPSPETDQIQVDLTAEAAPAIAAAYQLIATLQHSRLYIANMSFGPLLTAGLAVAEASYVPDILNGAGPRGTHVNDIASVRNVDPSKLGHTLRALASRHVFEEVSPDVFRNNRISSQLCTGKAVQDILRRPDDRWDGTNGLAAFVSLCGGLIFKATGSLVDNMLDSATAFSEEPNESAFARGHDAMACFDWLDLPQNTNELKKFGIAMAVGHSRDALAMKGFDWSSLPEAGKIVDVGGGVGTVTKTLAQVHRHLHYIVQDRPDTAKEGETLWKNTMPDFLDSGIVQFQGHNFFEEQPIKDADVFLVHYITHTWSDKYSQKILSRLRDAASPNTKLIVMDGILDYVCRGARDLLNISGAEKPLAPEPLLPYPETAISLAYVMDLTMMVFHNSQERTLEQFVSLFASAGWKLERVHRLPAPLLPQLVCTPA